jgi:hypothetical protein
VIERNPRSATSAARAVALALLATAALLIASAAAAGASGTDPAHAAPPTVSATISECVTSVVQAERSVTFSGEMSTVPGAARMAMRIEVEERLPQEALFRIVATPGAGAWRLSEPRVKVFKYLKQVTDLSAPARYRASIHFRWMNSRGATIRRASRLTKACEQPAAPPAPTGTGSAATGAGTATTTAA